MKVRAKDMRPGPSFATFATVVCMQIGIPGAAGPVAAQEVVGEEDVVILTALVIDARNGKALPGAVIELSRMVKRHVTGEDGRAEIAVPRGRHGFAVRRGRYEVLEGRLDASGPGELTLAMDRLWADDEDGTASLRVSIVDYETRREIPGARVSILDGESGVADELGHVWFSGLRMPVARISVEMAGYADFTVPIALHPFRIVAARVEMTAATDRRQPVEVKVLSRIAERVPASRWDRYVARYVGPDHVFTRETLGELGVSRLSNAFATLPGIVVKSLPSGGATLTTGGPCRVPVRVDGVNEAYSGSDIDQVPARWVETVEIHGLPHGCAVVYIWTRR